VPSGPLDRRWVRPGSVAWLVSSVQFIVAMVVTQLGWTTSYSLSGNTISDLGVVKCGQLTSPETGVTMYVCSPWHAVFNVSVVLFGLLVILGSVLAASGFLRSRSRSLGVGLLCLAGIGAIGVGLFPEDVNQSAHAISSLFAFVGGGVAMVLLSQAMAGDSRWDGFRAYTLLSGLITIIALILYLVGIYGPLGVGGLERVIVAPILLWLIVAGSHLMRARPYASPSVKVVTSSG
jgi:hypothetical membrane protein